VAVVETLHTTRLKVVHSYCLRCIQGYMVLNFTPNSNSILLKKFSTWVFEFGIQYDSASAS